MIQGSDCQQDQGGYFYFFHSISQCQCMKTATVYE